MPDSIKGIPIRKATELTGLSQRQIRYYEQKGLVNPKRTQGGQRVFSPHDVARLKQIRELHSSGYSLTAIDDILHGNNPGRRMSGRSLANLIPHTGAAVESVFPVRNQAKLYALLTRHNSNQEGDDQ